MDGGDIVSERILVHAVVYADGRIAGMSVVMRFTDGTYSIMPYTGEACGISFTNSIAVIAPPSMTAELRRRACTVRAIPELIAAVAGICSTGSVATAADPVLHILTASGK